MSRDVKNGTDQNVYGVKDFKDGIKINGSSVVSANSVTGALEVTGAVTADTTLHAVGATTLDSTLDVAGLASFTGGLAAPSENVTATNVITAAETGKTFFLNSATEFVSTLPAPAAGLKYTFIVVAAPSGASYTVVTNSSANVIKGQQHSAAGDAGDTGTADDTITFVDGQAVAGDRVDLVSDGTSWFAYAYSKVAAGITFTQAS